MGCSKSIINSKIHAEEQPQYGTWFRASLVKFSQKSSPNTSKRNYQSVTSSFNRRETAHQMEDGLENEGMHPFTQIVCKEASDHSGFISKAIANNNESMCKNEQPVECSK